MIVVDVGCAPRGDDVSVEPLIERFQPRVLYGFDPAEQQARHQIGETEVVISSVAAWTFTGTVAYEERGLRSAVGSGPETVSCFDLSEWLETLPAGEEIVLKIDAEGAEYPLLEKLHERELDARLTLLLVEWHGPPLELPFRCPVEEWA